MDNQVDKLPGERIGEVVRGRDLSATAIARRLGVNYQSLSHYHNGRVKSVPNGVALSSYIELLEELTGESADALGLGDLKRPVAA